MNDNKLDKKRIEEMYNNMFEIWPEKDKWYKYTHKILIQYINQHLINNKLDKSSKILNLGSGGNTYSIPGIHYHVDIAFERIKHLDNAYHCSAENIPFENNFFDGGLCIGSVIDYCDPFLVIHEIGRTLKKNAKFILDFEQSKSWQFIGTPKFNSAASIITSFNNFQEDKVWIFSIEHIKKILYINNLKIINIKYFHNITPLIYRIVKNEQISAKFCVLDKICSKLPYLKTISCNVILTIQKV